MSWLRKRVGIASVTFNPDKITAKARPRFSPKTGKAYTPKETSTFEETLAWLWIGKYHGRWSNFRGEVRIRVDYWQALAKSNPKKWVGRANMMKPDVDNVLKIVMDALNGIAYQDDAQVTLAIVCKRPRIPFGQNKIRIVLNYYNEEFQKEN